MKYPDQEARERRERAELIAAACHDIAVFCFGATAAVVVVGGLNYANESARATATYAGLLLFVLGSVVQYLGPRLF